MQKLVVRSQMWNLVSHGQLRRWSREGYRSSTAQSVKEGSTLGFDETAKRMAGRQHARSQTHSVISHVLARLMAAFRLSHSVKTQRFI